MKVISNELRDIVIEGVTFTPIDGGVPVPTDKIEAVKENFFFRHFVDIKAFEVIEAKVETKEEVKETPKRGRGRK
jgi:hypothetical protein